jgi:hypothetical protein
MAGNWSATSTTAQGGRERNVITYLLEIFLRPRHTYQIQPDYYIVHLLNDAENPVCGRGEGGKRI